MFDLVARSESVGERYLEDIMSVGAYGIAPRNRRRESKRQLAGVQLSVFYPDGHAASPAEALVAGYLEGIGFAYVADDGYGDNSLIRLATDSLAHQ